MRRAPIGLSFALLLVGTAHAQFIGPGSTPQGDYLRGVGIAAAGIGSYNRDTAIGYSITVDANIRLDTYIQAGLRANRDNWAKLDRLIQEKIKRNYDNIRRRIREHPEWLDVKNGNALNSVLGELNDPIIQESSFRSTPVPLSVEQIRQIPFKLGEKGVTFSMHRLTFRGKGRWPVALQDPRFAFECKMYERALDDALEHMIEKEMPLEVISTYEAAVQRLDAKLDQVFPQSREVHYNEAKTRLRELKKAAELLKIHAIQRVLADLDHYSGKTVNDLRLFMQKHNLQFADAFSPDEVGLYPQLYASLVEVRDVVKDRGKGGNK